MSPHPVVPQISAQGQMATHSPPTPSSARVERRGSLQATVERASNQPSVSEPNTPPNNLGYTSRSFPHASPKLPPDHTSDDSSHPSIEDALENSTTEPIHCSNTQLSATVPSPIAVHRIPTIRVQHPTGDPSQTFLEEPAVLEHQSKPEDVEASVRTPLQRRCTSPNRTTAAPDIPVTASQPPGGAAPPFRASTIGLHPNYVKPHKSRLMLRKCRNRLAAEPLLNFVLGRSVAKVAKPALRLAANPTEAVLALEDGSMPFV